MPTGMPVIHVRGLSLYSSSTSNPAAASVPCENHQVIIQVLGIQPHTWIPRQFFSQVLGLGWPIIGCCQLLGNETWTGDTVFFSLCVYLFVCTCVKETFKLIQKENKNKKCWRFHLHKRKNGFIELKFTYQKFICIKYKIQRYFKYPG